MKKLLLTLTILIASVGFAYAGYDTTRVNVADETVVDIDDVDSAYKAFVLDTTNGNAKVMTVYNLAAQRDIETVTAVNTLTTAECGKTIFISNATGFVNTLPAPVAGCYFKFVNITALTSGNHTIITNASANIVIGGINELEVDTGDDGSWVGDGDTVTFISAPAGVTASDTIGDYVKLESDGTSWYVHGQANKDATMSVTQAD
jgi:uncharacterized protein (UPF0333 family)